MHPTPTQLTPTYDPDSPIRVKGLVTEPTRSGFQILHNYESTYWRALVGNDAWSLYEVLRSFCHTTEQNQEEARCWPSIRLLAAILGLKERRVITGYTKTVKGKQYVYEGLIEKLHEYDLIIAREVGEGHEMHYEFDVILTPKQLSSEQVEKLPPLLQTKHKELLERCHKNLDKIKAGRRPSRVNAEANQNGSQKSSDSPAAGGAVNYRGGAVNYRGGVGNLPTEQQQYNNTQLTNTTVASQDHNNNSDGKKPYPDDKNDVVVALTERGLSEKAAVRISTRYKKERIFEKIEYRDWLVENAPDRIKNPAGWLRRAIEDNYAAPDGYVSKEDVERQKQQQEAQAKRKQIEEEKLAEERQKRIEQEEQEARLRLDTIFKRHGTTSEEREIGVKLKQTLQQQKFNAMLKESLELLKLGEGVAVIGFGGQFLIDKAKHPNVSVSIKRALRFVTQKEYEVEYVLFEDDS